MKKKKKKDYKRVATPLKKWEYKSVSGKKEYM